MPSKLYIVGVDPGWRTGGCAIVEVPPRERELVLVRTFPFSADDPSHLRMFMEIVQELSMRRIRRIYLEDQGPRPTDGRVSLFKVARGYGRIEGALLAVFPSHLINYVHPRTISARVKSVPASLTPDYRITDHELSALRIAYYGACAEKE